MAINDFSSLKTAVANWLHRSDLTDRIPDFISLAESRINRLIPTRGTEIETTLTATNGSAFINLPADFNTPVALWLEAWIPRRLLVLVAPVNLPYMPISTYPTYWALLQNQIKFDRLANANFNLTLRYIVLSHLSDAAPTNYILTNYPDLYLYATLIEAAPFIRDNDTTQMWETRFYKALDEVIASENQSKSNAILLTEPAKLTQRRTFNIYEG